MIYFTEAAVYTVEEVVSYQGEGLQGAFPLGEEAYAYLVEASYLEGVALSFLAEDPAFLGAA